MLSPLYKILSPELCREIQMHLKPRHLAKLLQTCKYLNMLLGTNNEYWTRVAAHLVWRNHVGITNHDDIEKNCEMVPNCLIDMVNLSRGYKTAMNEFVLLIGKEMARVHDDEEEDDMDPDKWRVFAGAPLDVQVRVGMQTFINWDEAVGYNSMSDTLLPMREIAMKIAVETATWAQQGTSKEASQRHMGMVRYINDLDDDNTIPIATKQRLMQGLAKAMTSIEIKNHGDFSVVTAHILPVDVVRSFVLTMAADDIR
jgi:hypothetical protein